MYIIRYIHNGKTTTSEHSDYYETIYYFMRLCNVVSESIGWDDATIEVEDTEENRKLASFTLYE